MRTNLQERKPPRSPFSGRIRQTPVRKAFAMPRLAVINDDEEGDLEQSTVFSKMIESSEVAVNCEINYLKF